MGMTRSNTQYEARHYWRLRQMVLDARLNADREEVVELIDEIDVLREMSDWPLLKERCTQLIAELQPVARRAGQ